MNKKVARGIKPDGAKVGPRLLPEADAQSETLGTESRVVCLIIRYFAI